MNVRGPAAPLDSPGSGGRPLAVGDGPFVGYQCWLAAGQARVVTPLLVPLDARVATEDDLVLVVLDAEPLQYSVRGSEGSPGTP